MEKEENKESVLIVEKENSKKGDILKLDQFSPFLSKDQLPEAEDKKSRNGVLNQVNKSWEQSPINGSKLDDEFMGCKMIKNHCRRLIFVTTIWEFNRVAYLVTKLFAHNQIATFYGNDNDNELQFEQTNRVI